LACGALDDVLLRRVEQVLHLIHGQLVLHDGLRQRFKNMRPARIARVVGVQALGELVFEFRQLQQTRVGGFMAFVGQIVGGSGKSVNGQYRRAQTRWAQPRGNGEVFGMTNGGHASIVASPEGVNSSGKIADQLVINL
jgi:hypothetical protein